MLLVLCNINIVCVINVVFGVFVDCYFFMVKRVVCGWSCFVGVVYWGVYGISFLCYVKVVWEMFKFEVVFRLEILVMWLIVFLVCVLVCLSFVFLVEEFYQFLEIQGVWFDDYGSCLGFVGFFMF